MTADEQAQRIHERLDDLFDKVADVDKAVGTLTAACGPCRDKVDRLGQVIDGNGRDGLKADVATLKASAKSEQDDFTQLLQAQERTVRWQRGQMGVMILGLLGFLAVVGKLLPT